MGKSGRDHRNYWYLLFKWSEYIFSSTAVGFSDKDSSSIHGILQARILEWEAIPSPGDIPDPGIKPRSLALQADSLSSEPPGKPQRQLPKW